MHNGLSTEAEGLLTKVQATGDGRGHRRFRRTDSAGIQIFLKEDVQFFLFRGGERVDLANCQLFSGNQFNGVVPWLWVRKGVKGLLGEHRAELPEVGGDFFRGNGCVR